MKSVPLKAGDTFSYSGIVRGLSAAYAWRADCAVSLNQVHLGDLTASLVHSADYAQTGNLVVTISATGAQTRAWFDAIKPPDLTRPFERVTLSCDIKFSVGGADPIVHCETFGVNLTPGVTL